MLERQPWNRLAPSIERAGADPAAALPLLRRYAELLLDWNRNVSSLISRNDEPRIVERHLLESIVPAGWLRESAMEHWLDFGSGGGFPAIPLAIIGIGSRWTLVESRRPKMLFLTRLVQELELRGIEVVHSRLESLIADPSRVWAVDAFTSRATMPLEPTLKLAERVVREGGCAFLWKGSGREQELRDVTSRSTAWEDAGALPIDQGPTAVIKFIRKK